MLCGHLGVFVNGSRRKRWDDWDVLKLQGKITLYLKNLILPGAQTRKLSTTISIQSLELYGFFYEKFQTRLHQNISLYNLSTVLRVKLLFFFFFNFLSFDISWSCKTLDFITYLYKHRDLVKNKYFYKCLQADIFILLTFTRGAWL